MNRSHRRTRAARAALGDPDPHFSPWLRFDIDRDDSQDVLANLVDAPAVNAEVETWTTRTRLVGEVTAHEVPGFGCGLRVTDANGDVHDDDDIRAVRFRLDAQHTETVQRLVWDAILGRIPLLGLQLATGELRTGLPVGFDIDTDRPLATADSAWVHLLPIPLEALNTDDIWTTVRLAMYSAARSFRDNRLECHFLDRPHTDTYSMSEVLAVAWLEDADSACHWLTSVVPAFELQRPVIERTRLWFTDDAGRPFQRAHVDSTTGRAAAARWPGDPRR